MSKISKLIGMCIILIILASISIFSVQATNNREQAQKEDAEYYKMQRNKIAAENIENSEVSRSYASYPSPYNSYGKVYAIDVSHNNNNAKPLDWNKIYKAGIKYAIIRVAYRGYGDGQVYSDWNYYENLTNAKAAGLKVGVYFYSSAINESEAEYEANYIVDRVTEWEKDRNLSIDLPIFMDYEGSGGNGSWRVEQNVGDATNLVRKFCDKVKSRGYKAGVYAGLYFKVNMTALSNENYFIWLANYNATALSEAKKYNCDVDIWQINGSDYVDGIGSGYVDMDVIFLKNNANNSDISISKIKVEEGTYDNSQLLVSWNSTLTSGEYQIVAYKDGKKIATKTIKHNSSILFGNHQEVNFENMSQGKYVFKIRAKDANQIIESYSDWIESSAYNLKAHIGDPTTATSTPASGSKNVTVSTATIKWNKIDNARGYYIYKYNADKKEWVNIKTVNVSKYNVPKTSETTVDLEYGENKFMVRGFNDDFGKNNIKENKGSNRIVLTRVKSYYTYTFNTDAAYKKMKAIFTAASKTDVTATDKTKTIKVWDEIVKTKIGTKLDLSNSNLTNSDLAIIFKYEYPKVSNIDLSNNKLTSADNIKNCPKLTTLTLSNNSISNTNGLYGFKDTLSYLNLNNNKLTSCAMFASLSKLKYLYLENNYIESIKELNLTKYSTISLKNQTINREVKGTYCAYPNIFVEARKTNSSALYCYNCKDSTTGATITNTSAKSIYVSIQSGVAKGTKLNITLGDRVLTGISIGDKPTKTEYSLNEKLDLTGGTIRLKYSSGEESISMTEKDVTVSGFASNTAGTKTVTIAYGGKTATFTVTVTDNSLASIEVSKEPNKTEYTVGDKLDLTGGKIKLKYNNSKESIIDMTSSGVNVTGFNSNKAGVQQLTVTYNGKTAKFNIAVKEKKENETDPSNDKPSEKTLTSISVQVRPTKVIYIKNKDKLSLTGGTILAKYSDNSTETIKMIESEVKVTGFDNSKVGENTLTITYKGKTTTFKVTITEASIVSISVKSKPTQTSYTKNYDDLKLDGGKLELKYSDNATEIIDMTSEGVEVEGFDNSTLGTNTLTVTYREKTTTFTVQIVAKRLETMKISELPTKTTYIKESEELSLENGRLSLTYNDGSQEIMDMESEELKVEGFDNTKVGTNKITITYENVKVSFNVSIIEKDIDEIALESYPRRRQYVQMGEGLNLSGGKIKIMYSDGTEDKIDMTADGVEVEGFDNSKPGTNTLTVKYGGKSLTFDITINGDEGKPELEVEVTPKNFTMNIVTLDIEVSDGGSGIENVTVNGEKIDIKDGKATYEIENNGTYVVIAKDKVGNESRQDVVIDQIGKAGDINENGKIDLNDLLKLTQHIAAQRTNNKRSSWYLSESKQELADVNKDGKIDSRDVLKIKRYLAASKSEIIKKKNPSWENI